MKNETNIGFGRGNNRGIRHLLGHTDCEAIFILNNDTKVETRTIKNLSLILEQYPEVGVAAPKIMRIDQPDQTLFSGGSISWFRGAGQLDADSQKQKNITFATGCAMLVRRDVFEDVGGFDPRFFMYEEDLELCLRILKAGWKIIYQPESVVFHRLHGSQGSERGVSLPAFHPANPRLSYFVFHMTRNRLLNMYIHAKGRHAIQFFIGFPVYSLYYLSQFVLNGRFEAVTAWIKGIVAFIFVFKKPYMNELKPEDNDRPAQ